LYVANIPDRYTLVWFDTAGVYHQIHSNFGGTAFSDNHPTDSNQN